jgi:hypothetical protein
MLKIKKGHSFLSLVLFSLLLISLANSFLPSLVYAAEETIEGKGLTISNDVLGLNIAEYAVTTKEHPQKYDPSYLGIVPQKVVVCVCLDT